jgi:hypothetical protein
MVYMGGLGWFAGWIAYMAFYYSGPYMAGIPRQGWDVIGPTVADARAFRRWKIAGLSTVDRKSTSTTYICGGELELDVAGDATAVVPEIPNSYQDCFIGGFDMRFTVGQRDQQLSDDLLSAIDLCKPTLWNLHGIAWGDVTVEDLVEGQPPLGFVVPGDVPLAMGKSSWWAAGFFATGLGYQYAAYATSPVYRVVVTRENATLVGAPETVTCDLFKYSCED